MATYHTNPCTGLRAPSDIELAAADRQRNAISNWQCTFNEFTLLIGLTGERARFHAYIKDAGLAGTSQTSKEWWRWFGRMLKDADAKDQHDTQNDALR